VFKRVRWMSMGAVAGAGASVWAQYRLRRTIEEHPGVKLSAQAATKARRLGLEVRDALVEGRAAMAEREATLQAELDERLVPLGEEGAGPSEPARLHVVDARSEPVRPPRGELAAARDHKARRRRWTPKHV
jgi:hypothetical protein